MKTIFNSASKIVFVIIALAVVILTFLKIIDAKDFMMLASMVFTYYFTRDKGENQTPIA